ncbi:WD40-repeat-containing domain protein [Fomes fomentarius]|nr:WD40-repeat-containing domain protein [Fomes fomentarius]
MVPVPLLTSLSNLFCWRFCGISYRSSSDMHVHVYPLTLAYHRKALATIRRLATTVRELHLIKLAFITPVDCARLVSSMPALRKLRCEDVGFKLWQDPEVVDTCIDRLAPILHVESLTLINFGTQGVDLLLKMLQSTIETLTFEVRLAANDPTLSLISRLERLRSLRLFVGDHDSFAAMIKPATNVLNSLARLDALTVEIKYESPSHLEVFGDSRDDETACQQFEESAIRLNPSRVLFVLGCYGRERTVLWTRTLQCIFPTLHKQCPFKVQCQGDLDDLAEPNSYGHDGTVDALAASPDGRWIASASEDETLILWRVDRGHGGPAHLKVAVDWCTGQDIEKLQFSPDSRYIASVAATGVEICIWDVTTGTRLGTLGMLGPRGLHIGLSRMTSCIVWLQDGTLVVSHITTNTKRLFCWYTVPSKELTGSGGLTNPPSLAIPPDATYSITDRGLVQVAYRRLPLMTMREEYLEHSISLDGSLLALLDTDGSVTMWDMAFGTLSPPRHMRLGLPTPGPSIEGDPLNAVSDLATQKSFIAYHEIPIWYYAIVDRVYSNAPVAQGGITLLIMMLDSELCTMCFSPCGRLFATNTSRSLVVHLWRVNDGMCLATFNPPDYLDPFRAKFLTTCSMFTQDSQTLVYGDNNGTVHVRDIGHLDVLAGATSSTTVAQ